jgi:hypothetical protein
MTTPKCNLDRGELGTVVRDMTMKVLVREVDVARARPEVTDVRFVRDTSPATGRAVNIISICILCDARDLVIGRTVDIAPSSRDGHLSDYMAGVIYASLVGAGIGEDFRVALDVVERPANGDTGQDSTGMYTYRTIADAQGADFIALGSPLMREIERYALQYVLTSGRVLCGPSLGLIVETRNLLAEMSDAFVMDLFCGPAGLTRVALREGAAEVLAVDQVISHDVVRANLGDVAAKARIVERDSAYIRPDHQVDLLICDPFYETAIAQVETVRPWLRERARHMIVNLGPISHPAWCASVRALVADMLPIRYERVHGLETIGVFG